VINFELRTSNFERRNELTLVIICFRKENRMASVRRFLRSKFEVRSSKFNKDQP